MSVTKINGLWATDPPPITPDGQDITGRDFDNINASRQYYYASTLLDKLENKTGKLLDIGCGAGYLVSYADKIGFKAMGIDLYPDAIKYAKNNLKINAQKISLLDFKPKEKFDVIILNHVLEHITDLKKFLNKIKSLLKPQGLVLIACPNYQSLMRIIFKSRWYGLRPEMHVWQLTPKMLSGYLKLQGFKNIKNYSASLDYDPPNKIKNLIFKIMVYIANKINLGDQIIMTAQI